MTEFDAHTLYVMRRHQYLSDIYGEAPEAVASAGEYFQKQMLASAGKVALADPYLFGDKIGVADILLTSCIDWALRYGQELDLRYLDYFARTRARRHISRLYHGTRFRDGGFCPNMKFEHPGLNRSYACPTII